MFVFQTDYDGIYLRVVTADESPLEPGVFLIPGGCVTEQPPPFTEEEMARWVDGAWVIEPRPVPEPEPELDPEPEEPIELGDPTRVQMVTVWSRLSDEEADLLDEAVRSASTRLRRIFDAAQALDNRDPDYPALRGIVVIALGEERAEVVLTPDVY